MMTEQNKRTWQTPELVSYGNVEDITQGTGPMCKKLGSIDDFGVPGIEDASGCV